VYCDYLKIHIGKNCLGDVCFGKYVIIVIIIIIIIIHVRSSCIVFNFKFKFLIRIRICFSVLRDKECDSIDLNPCYSLVRKISPCRNSKIGCNNVRKKESIQLSKLIDKVERQVPDGILESESGSNRCVVDDGDNDDDCDDGRDDDRLLLE